MDETMKLKDNNIWNLINRVLDSTDKQIILLSDVAVSGLMEEVKKEGSITDIKKFKEEQICHR